MQIAAKTLLTRAAVAALEHGVHGHLDPAQVGALAAELRASVQAMFVQCRLAPEPDAALHPLLARVLDAAVILDSGVVDRAAMAVLASVLARYQQLFIEPATAEPAAP